MSQKKSKQTHQKNPTPPNQTKESSSGYQVGDKIDSDDLFKKWAESDQEFEFEDQAPKKRLSFANSPIALILIILLSAYLCYGSYPAFKAVLEKDQYDDCGDVTLRPDQREKNPSAMVQFRHKQKCILKGVAQSLNVYEVGKAENPESKDPFEVKKGLSYVLKLVGDKVFAIVPAHEQWVEGYKIKTESLAGLEINGKGIMVSPKLDRTYAKLGDQLRLSFQIPDEEEIFFFDMGYDPMDQKLPLFTFFFSPIVMLIALIALRKLLLIKKVEKQIFKSSQIAQIIFLLCSLAFYAQPSMAQVTPSQSSIDLKKISALKLQNPMIWKFYHPSQPKQISFLIGTIHIPHSNFKPLPKIFSNAIDQTNGFYGELDLSDKQAMAIQMMGAAMLQGQTLSSLISPKSKEILDRFLTKQGVPTGFFDAMHPSFVELMILAFELKDIMLQGSALDELLFQYAKEKNKKIGGIETVQEQINAIMGKDVKQAAIALDFSLSKMDEELKKGRIVVEELMQVYFEGSEEKIDAFNQKELQNAPKAQIEKMKALLDERNQTMVKRIIEMLQKNPKESYTFGFGAAHFVSGGEQSVLSLLKKQGYTIQRVKE